MAKAQGHQTKQERRPLMPAIGCEHTPVTRLTHVLTSVTGNHPSHGPHQQTLPGPRTQAVDLRSNTTDHRSGSIKSPLLPAEHPRRVIRRLVRFPCFVVVSCLALCLFSSFAGLLVLPGIACSLQIIVAHQLPPPHPPNEPRQVGELICTGFY